VKRNVEVFFFWHLHARLRDRASSFALSFGKCHSSWDSLKGVCVCVCESLDWFEVDRICSHSFLTQNDLCIVYVTVGGIGCTLRIVAASIGVCVCVYVYACSSSMTHTHRWTHTRNWVTDKRRGRRHWCKHRPRPGSRPRHRHRHRHSKRHRHRHRDRHRDTIAVAMNLVILGARRWYTRKHARTNTHARTRTRAHRCTCRRRRTHTHTYTHVV